MTDKPATSEIRTRAAVALVFGALTAAYAAARVLHEPLWPTDFDQLWHAARSLLAGTSPYELVGPGRAFQWDWPLYFPLPAVLIALPFTTLPILWARIAFSAVSGTILGWALGHRVWTHWPILLSAAFIISTSRGQWSTLLLASTWLPALAFLVTAKPNVGIAAAVTLRRNQILPAIVSCGLILIAAVVARPEWFYEWREAIGAAQQKQAAVTILPAGPLLALAAVKWRRAEARLFLAMVTVPHTPSIYDLVLLFFACRTARETMLLSLLTQAVFWSVIVFGTGNTFDAYSDSLGRRIIYIVYLPVLAALLARPNRSDDSSGSVATGSMVLPRNWFDAIILSLLLVAATFLIWLPLVTHR